MDYQGLYNTLVNILPNSPIEYKKLALRNVATSLKSGQEPDFRLRLKAVGTLASLDVMGLRPENEILGWLNAELDDYKEQLQEKLHANPDIEMAQGGRKKRRKTKKGKKTRRYTRRWQK